LLIGKGTIVDGFNGIVNGSIRVGEGLIVGYYSISVVKVYNVAHDSTVVGSDIIGYSTIVRVHNLVYVV
jgi:hypothetical protein